MCLWSGGYGTGVDLLKILFCLIVFIRDFWQVACRDRTYVSGKTVEDSDSMLHSLIVVTHCSDQVVSR